MKIERFIRAMNYPPLPPAIYKNHEIRTYGDYIKLKNTP